jgi:epoxyqueuosine reductase
VARYARGSDYHDHMLARLERVGERLAAEAPGLEFRAYVDTGPILERELAARAGLGAIGKNTNLLSPELGSWFLLGELLLSTDLEPDLPLGDLCGECTRCLEACPTGALPAPFHLDAGRCISYWTIEHRGSIPAAMRAGMGTWTFGCDVCQEVCPWNSRPAAIAGRAELEPPAAARGLDLVALLSLDDAALRERFRGTALLRPKPEGLRRNAAVALANRGAPGDAEALAAALAADASPLVRGHAAWALGRLGGPAERRELARAAAAEADPEVRAEIAAARAGVIDNK